MVQTTGMAASRERLLEEALRLPEDQRASLVAELLESFGAPPTEIPRASEEWIAEVERRAREAMSGASSVSWEKAQAQIRKHLTSK